MTWKVSRQINRSKETLAVGKKKEEFGILKVLRPRETRCRCVDAVLGLRVTVGRKKVGAERGGTLTEKSSIDV